MSWTQEVWQKSLPIYERITRHPFIKELADGTLAQEKFARYLAQDEIYIKNYGEEMFRTLAKEGMEAEAAMHQMLIESFGIDTAVEPSDVTAGYMAHTRKYINTGNPALALAAMLPCMWIYNEVGLYIYNHRNPNPNPYAEWVATYASEDFTECTRQILEMCDRYAEEATPELKEEMTAAYLIAAEYEWAFWNWGYCGEQLVTSN